MIARGTWIWLPPTLLLLFLSLLLSAPDGWGTPEPLNRVDKALAAAVLDCTTTNASSQPHGCVALFDAVVDTNGTVYFPTTDQRNAAATKVLRQKSRNTASGTNPFPFLREMTSTQRVSWLPSNASAATVGYYGLPVHWYDNVWHTLVQQLFSMLQTVAPLVREGIDVEWVTDVPTRLAPSVCNTSARCRQKPLFHPFTRLFSSIVFFREDFERPARRRHYPRLLVGLNPVCYPSTRDTMADPRCLDVMERYRQLVLGSTGHPTERSVTESERRCPQTVIVSRQHVKFRKVFPFDAMVENLRESYRTRGCNDTALVRVVAPSAAMSFREQLSLFVNATVLVAARGAASTFSAFLAKGGGLLSLSWSGDRWQPYQALSPPWSVVEHVPVELVHHDDPDRKPVYGSRRRIDTNWCGYKVDPEKAVAGFWRLVQRLPPWPASV